MLTRRTGEPEGGGEARPSRGAGEAAAAGAAGGTEAAGAAGALLDEIEAEAAPLVLGRFDLDETAAFLAAHGFGDLDPVLVPALHRVTGGHPLHLRRLVAAGPPGPGAAAGEPPPGGLREAIDRALAGLEPGARAVLQAGAVLGPSPSVAETAAVAGCAPARVLEAVAAADGIADAEGPDRFAFTHELVRAALERSLPPAARLDAHARAAAVVAGDGAEGAEPSAEPDAGPVADVPPERLARRAHHALAAAPRSPDDARLAVAVCRQAARSLAANLAYEAADELLSAAVACHEASRLGPPAGALLVEWAQAALRCGRLADARRRFGVAGPVVAGEDEPALAAEVALGLGGHWGAEYRTPVDRARVLGLQRAARAGLPAGEDALRCRLDVRLAAEAVFDGAPVEPVLDALEAARGTGDPRALAEALSLTHHVLLTPGRAPGRLALADELVRVASQAGLGVLALMGLCWRAVDLFLAGDDRARRALEDLRERAEALACQSILYMVGVIDTMLLVRAGRLAEAEAAAERNRARGEAIGEVDTLGYYASHLLAIRWIQGREVELLDLADHVATSPTLTRDEFAFRAAAAAFAARAGQRDRARAALDQLTAGGLAALPQSSTYLVGMTAVVELAAELGDRTVARQAYEVLAPYAGLPAMGGLAVLCLGSVERALGLAAAAQGDHDRAVAHLERAVAANHRLGNRPLAAIAAANLAGARRRRGRPGDAERADRDLAAAVAEGRALGMDARVAAWTAGALLPGEAADEAGRAAGPGDIGAGAARAGGCGPAGAGTRRATIRREGDRWHLALDGRSAVVADRIGMRYLAELVTRPGQTIPALTLASGGAVADDAGRQELVDAEARARYRARAEELRRELAEAEAGHDLARAERLRDEMDALADELEGAVGIGGRPRAFSDQAERARSAVGKAIRRALGAIDEVDPELAELLRSGLSTGTRCSWTPDPRRPVRWTTAGGREPPPAAAAG